MCTIPVYSRDVGPSHFSEGEFQGEGENLGQEHHTSTSAITVLTVSINRTLSQNLEGNVKKILTEDRYGLARRNILSHVWGSF